MAFQFSDTLDQTAISTLLTFVETKTGNQRDVLRAAFVLADFGSQFVLGEPTPSVTVPMGAPDAQALAGSLRQLKAQAGNPNLRGAINWANLLALILKFLPLILPFIKPAT